MGYVVQRAMMTVMVLPPLNSVVRVHVLIHHASNQVRYVCV